MEAHVKRLEKQLALATEALRWYADRSNWSRNHWGSAVIALRPPHNAGEGLAQLALYEIEAAGQHGSDEPKTKFEILLETLGRVLEENSRLKAEGEEDGR